jgi:hypothetical protein
MVMFTCLGEIMADKSELLLSLNGSVLKKDFDAWKDAFNQLIGQLIRDSERFGSDPPVDPNGRPYDRRFSRCWDFFEAADSALKGVYQDYSGVDGQLSSGQQPGQYEAEKVNANIRAARDKSDEAGRSPEYALRLNEMNAIGNRVVAHLNGKLGKEYDDLLSLLRREVRAEPERKVVWER